MRRRQRTTVFKAERSRKQKKLENKQYRVYFWVASSHITERRECKNQGLGRLMSQSIQSKVLGKKWVSNQGQERTPQ
jgi:hypothetical protein